MKEILLADKEMVFLVILYFNGIYYLFVKIWYCSLWLRSLSNWGFTFGSDQTFVTEIVVSYW